MRNNAIMDPPPGTGFIRQKQQEHHNTIKSTQISTSHNCRISNRNTKKNSGKSGSSRILKDSTVTIKATATTTKTTLRHHMPKLRHLSVLVCVVAIVALNNLGCFITTTTAQSSVPRQNTRVLPLLPGEYQWTISNREKKIEKKSKIPFYVKRLSLYIYKISFYV